MKAKSAAFNMIERNLSRGLRNNDLIIYLHGKGIEIDAEMSMSFFDTLHGDEKTVARLLYNGYNQREIAAAINYSQAWVNKIIKDIRTKFIEYK